MEPRYCGHCGTLIDPKAAFCTGCGKPAELSFVKAPKRRRGPIWALGLAFAVLGGLWGFMGLANFVVALGKTPAGGGSDWVIALAFILHGAMYWFPSLVAVGLGALMMKR